MNNEEVYRKLRDTLTDEEIADSAVIPADLTSAEREEADDELKKERQQQLRGMSATDQLLADLMRLRFQIENYVRYEPFSSDHTFGSYLREYVHILRRDRKTIADDLALHYTKLSRILNDKEEPSVALCYRLDTYSGQLITADWWWKLVTKKQEAEMMQNKKAQKMEGEKVKNALIVV